jgi:7-cyano-7-deazaguanine synthase
MKVVAVVSGGLDSFSYMGKYKNEDIYPIAFHYGQKGYVECQIAEQLCKDIGINPIKIVDLESLSDIWKGTQLTDSQVVVEDGYVPSVVVPLRNAIFLTVGMAYAYTIGAEVMIYGAHSDDVGTSDVPLYPDCSSEFVNSLENTLFIGHFNFWNGSPKVKVLSPSREGVGKSGLISMGYAAFGDLIFKTWSCYNTDSVQCGICESCRNRKSAFKRAGVEDKTVYKE